jgi:hypothetical protein
MRYNATAYRIDPAPGQAIGCLVAEVDEQGRMLRNNAVPFTGLEGRPEYDAYLRRTGYTFRIERDGGAGYRQRRLGLARPPGYVSLPRRRGRRK